jgi:hypothetical protein
MGVQQDLAGAGFSIEVKDLDPDRRPKRMYYRKCGMEVGPWPYDEKSKKLYLSKGFLLEPPIPAEPPKPLLKCQICGTRYGNISDLVSCLEKHNKEVNNGIS